MSGQLLGAHEPPPGERRQIDCVELYLPKTIEFLPELYQLLRQLVTNRLGAVVLDGFSIYEVDGVFRGQKLWEQRTLVIRLLLLRPPWTPPGVITGPAILLGKEIVTRVAPREEEIWVCHYPQTLMVFQGLKPSLK